MQINKQNIDYWCLLYIDNALTKDEKNLVDSFIATHKEYKALLESYQQTIVPIESNIVFEDKALLYRFDALDAQLDTSFKKQLYKKESSIIAMPLWVKWSVGVAALLLLILTIPLLKNSNKMATIKPLVVNQNKKEATAPTKELVISSIPLAQHSDELATTTATPPLLLSLNKEIQKTTSNNVAIDTIVSTPKTSDLLAATSIVDNNNAIVAAVKNSNPVTTTTITPSQEEVPSVISEEDNDHVIYVGALEINSDKFRGVTRRINAFLKRTKITEKDE